MITFRRRLLQRALLPGRLPELPGYELVGALRPQRRARPRGRRLVRRVPAPGGRVGIVIGDVGGRGLERPRRWARSATRCAPRLKGRPAEVLDDLHALVDAAGGEIPFATRLYSSSTPRPASGEVATAGHLPPLLAGDRPLRRRAALPAARLQRRRGLHARALLARRRARRCGSSPTAWSSPASGRSTPASRARRRRGPRHGDLDAIADQLLVELPAARDDDIALLGLRRVAKRLRRVARTRRIRDTCICEMPTRSAIRAGRGPRRTAGAALRADGR